MTKQKANGQTHRKRASRKMKSLVKGLNVRKKAMFVFTLAQSFDGDNILLLQDWKTTYRVIHKYGRVQSVTVTEL